MSRFNQVVDTQTGEVTMVPYTAEDEAAADARAAAEAAEAPRKAILAQIAALETSVTTRMIREAILNAPGQFPVGHPHAGKTAKQAVSDLNDQIAALRAQLAAPV